VTVAVHWLQQAAADVPAADDWLAPAELARQAALRAPGRRADWRLGRWTAKRALAVRLTADAPPPAAAAVEIRNAPDGAPEVLVGGRPAPLAISLSHRAGLAVCMVAPAGTALGCDLELVEPHSDVFVADYLTAPERAAVQAATATDRTLLVSLLWSAKESALKALRAGLRLDTRWVAVDPPPPAGPGRWHPLTVRHPATGRVFPGWWRHDAGRVLTMVATPPPSPPQTIPIGSGPALPRPGQGELEGRPRGGLQEPGRSALSELRWPSLNGWCRHRSRPPATTSQTAHAGL
jgi:4'-phosphopantetheinyl transferase